MPLDLADPQLDALAERLAAITGRTKADIVHEALVRYAANLNRRHDGPARSDDLRRLQDRLAPLFAGETRGAKQVIDEALYDEHGDPA
jgi:hypothetical protein